MRPNVPFRLVVNHLTRMRLPYICVAGVTDDGRHVRLQRQGGRWTRESLVENGGPFGIGEVVEVTAGRWIPSPPETEDFETTVTAVRWCGHLGDEAFWSTVERAAAMGRQLLPPELERTSTGRAFQRLGSGMASLTCWAPVAPDLVTVGESEIRLTFAGPDGRDLSLPVTDLRLFEADQVTLRRAVRRLVAVRLAQGHPTIVSLGLGRPFPPEEPVHWLQVNNIHFPDYLDEHPVFRPI